MQKQPETQETTIDNLAETLEYNGWVIKFSRSDELKSSFNNKIKQHVICVAPNNNSIIEFKRTNKECEIIEFTHHKPFIFLRNTNLTEMINLIRYIRHIEITPLPVEPDNLWDWALQNGWHEYPRNPVQPEVGLIELGKVQLISCCWDDSCYTFRVKTDDPGILIHEKLIDKSLSLDKQIKLLTTFMEVYSV